MPKLSIVIVSWNVQDLLRRCLASLAVGDDGLPDEIIVVDGASADGSADMVQAEFPFVRVLRQTENVGFSRGNNLGLAEATGRYLCLLNPDTEVVGDVRGKGPMLALELAKERKTKALVKFCHKRGLILPSCGNFDNVIRLLMPLVIGDKHFERGLAITEEGSTALHNNPSSTSNLYLGRKTSWRK